MKIPHLGEFIAQLLVRVFPNSRVWRGLVFTVCFTTGLFLAFLKLSRGWWTE